MTEEQITSFLEKFDTFLDQQAQLLRHYETLASIIENDPHFRRYNRGFQNGRPNITVPTKAPFKNA